VAARHGGDGPRPGERAEHAEVVQGRDRVPELEALGEIERRPRVVWLWLWL
jgi:hypothetical protein